MINLTYEEAIELRNELSVHCVSYYNLTLRDALEKVIKHCNGLIEEYEEIQFDINSAESKME